MMMIDVEQHSVKTMIVVVEQQSPMMMTILV